MYRSQIYSVEQAQNGRLYPEDGMRYFVSLAVDEKGEDWRTAKRIRREEIAAALAEGRAVQWRDTSCAFCGGPTPCTRND
jgi:hypothetical protein